MIPFLFTNRLESASAQATQCCWVSSVNYGRVGDAPYIAPSVCQSYAGGTVSSCSQQTTQCCWVSGVNYGQVGDAPYIAPSVCQSYAGGTVSSCSQQATPVLLGQRC